MESITNEVLSQVSMFRSESAEVRQPVPASTLTLTLALTLTLTLILTLTLTLTLARSPPRCVSRCLHQP